MIQWQLYSSSGVVIDLFAYFADSSLNTILLICFLTEKYPDFFSGSRKLPGVDWRTRHHDAGVHAHRRQDHPPSLRRRHSLGGRHLGLVSHQSFH